MPKFPHFTNMLFFAMVNILLILNIILVFLLKSPKVLLFLLIILKNKLKEISENNFELVFLEGLSGLILNIILSSLDGIKGEENHEKCKKKFQVVISCHFK